MTCNQSSRASGSPSDTHRGGAIPSTAGRATVDVMGKVRNDEPADPCHGTHEGEWVRHGRDGNMKICKCHCNFRLGATAVDGGVHDWEVSEGRRAGVSDWNSTECLPIASVQIKAHNISRPKLYFCMATMFILSFFHKFRRYRNFWIVCFSMRLHRRANLLIQPSKSFNIEHILCYISKHPRKRPVFVRSECRFRKFLSSVNWL